MRNTKYVLDDNGNPRPATMEEWVKMFEDSEGRIVKQEYVGKLFISTVFLGLDHGWGNGPPVLWETMVFHPNPEPLNKKRRFNMPRHKMVELDGYTERCSGNKEQAEAMHERVVAKVREIVQ